MRIVNMHVFIDVHVFMVSSQIATHLMPVFQHISNPKKAEGV